MGRNEVVPPGMRASDFSTAERGENLLLLQPFNFIHCCNAVYRKNVKFVLIDFTRWQDQLAAVRIITNAWQPIILPHKQLRPTSLFHRTPTDHASEKTSES